jgi:hypothetical protein
MVLAVRVCVPLAVLSDLLCETDEKLEACRVSLALLENVSSVLYRGSEISFGEFCFR